mgnify:CR=1 FL=1
MSIILIGLCMLGIFFCIAALCIQYTYAKKLKLCTASVRAEIIDMVVETSRVEMDSYYRQSYYPIFRYTYNNVEYTAQSNLGYSKGREAIGDIEELFINPNHPEQIFRNKSTWKHLFYLFLWVGLGILAIAVVFYSIMIWI